MTERIGTLALPDRAAGVASSADSGAAPERTRPARAPRPHEGSEAPAQSSVPLSSTLATVK